MQSSKMVQMEETFKQLKAEKDLLAATTEKIEIRKKQIEAVESDRLSDEERKLILDELQFDEVASFDEKEIQNLECKVEEKRNQIHQLTSQLNRHRTAITSAHSMSEKIDSLPLQIDEKLKKLWIVHYWHLADGLGLGGIIEAPVDDDHIAWFHEASDPLKLVLAMLPGEKGMGQPLVERGLTSLSLKEFDNYVARIKVQLKFTQMAYLEVENQVVEFVKVSEPLVKDEERIKHQADTIQEYFLKSQRYDEALHNKLSDLYEEIKRGNELRILRHSQVLFKQTWLACELQLASSILLTDKATFEHWLNNCRWRLGDIRRTLKDEKEVEDALKDFMNRGIMYEVSFQCNKTIDRVILEDPLINALQ